MIESPDGFDVVALKGTDFMNTVAATSIAELSQTAEPSPRPVVEVFLDEAGYTGRT